MQVFRMCGCLILLALLVGCNGQNATTETTTTASKGEVDTTAIAGDTSAVNHEKGTLTHPLPPTGPGYQSPRFSYAGRDGHKAKMVAALSIADSLCALPAFWKAVSDYPEQKIDNSAFTMHMLADTLAAFSRPVTIAYTNGLHVSNALTGPEKIRITRYGIRQDKYSLAVTFIHEWVHAVDYSLHPTRLQFAHHAESQDRCLNKETASYRIERVAEKLLGNPDFALTCRN